MMDVFTNFFDAVRDIYGFNEMNDYWEVDKGAVLLQTNSLRRFFTKRLFKEEFEKINSISITDRL